MGDVGDGDDGDDGDCFLDVGFLLVFLASETGQRGTDFVRICGY